MSELNTIVESLFQQPFAPAPPIEQLERRRAQRHRRRRGAYLGAAVVFAVTLVGSTQIGDARDREVNSVDGRSPFASVPPHDPVTESGAAPLVAPRPGPAPTPTLPRLGATATTTAIPAREGCAVESAYDEGVETPFGGAGYGTKECDYTATVAAGYVAHGYWRLRVMRAGVQVVFLDNGYRGEDPTGSKRTPPSPCGAVGIIQPGDQVFLYLRYGAETVADPTYVRAGADQHC